MSLLGLSIEIRLMIYEHLSRDHLLDSIHDDTTLVHRHEHRTRSCGPKGIAKTQHSQSPYIQDKDGYIKRNHMAILQVNRILRNEAKQTMYENSYTVLPAHDMLQHHTVNDELLVNIRHLQLILRQSDQLRNKLFTDFGRLSELKSLLINFRQEMTYAQFLYGASLEFGSNFAKWPTKYTPKRNYLRRSGRENMKHIKWIGRILTTDRTFRILCLFQVPDTDGMRTLFLEMPVDGAPYEYERDWPEQTNMAWRLMLRI